MALNVIGTQQFLNSPIAPLLSIPQLSYTGTTRRKGPINGEQWWVTFESPASEDITKASPAEMGYLIVRNIFQAEVKTGGPIHYLTLITPDDPTGAQSPVISSNFELLGNDLQLDLRLHPKSLSIESTHEKSAARIAVIDAVLNGDQKSSGSGTSTTPYTIADVTGALSISGTSLTALSGQKATDALTLYYLLRQARGNAYIQQAQYVFRFSRICSNDATIDVGYSNVGKLLTTGQMTGETGPPGGILTAIGDAFTTSQPADAVGFAYRWLKRTPTVATTANNKYQVSGEYWLGFFSTWAYDAA